MAHLKLTKMKMKGKRGREWSENNFQNIFFVLGCTKKESPPQSHRVQPTSPYHHCR